MRLCLCAQISSNRLSFGGNASVTSSSQKSSAQRALNAEDDNLPSLSLSLNIPPIVIPTQQQIPIVEQPDVSVFVSVVC